MRGHEGDGLGHVQGGAAAEADDGVGMVGTPGRCSRRHLAFHGIARHVREQGGLEPGRPQALQDLARQGERGQAFVRDHQRPPGALGREMGARVPAHAGTELDEGGKAEGGHGIVYI